MELFLIRHGESTNNSLEMVLGENYLNGRSQDPELTEKGERQAACAAAFLAGGGHLHPAERATGRPFLDQLYCSAMIRALHTAQLIGKALGLRPQVWLDIHEVGGIYLDQGEEQVGFPGQTRSQLLERFPEAALPSQLTEAGWWNRGFEEPHQGQGRAIGVAQELRRRAGESRRIGLVSHGDFMNNLLKALGDQLPWPGGYYEHVNTGITRIDLPPAGRMVVKYLNRADHLPAELL